MKYSFLLFLIIVLLGCKKYETGEGLYKDDFQLVLADTAGVKADGTSSITLRLHNTLAVKDGLKVTFSSTKGAVLIAEQPYRNNLAETKLLLAEDTGTFFVKAVIKDGDVIKLEKFLTVSFPPLYNASDYHFSVTDSTGARANGATKVNLRFTGPTNVKMGLTVHLETNKGTLLQNALAYQSGLAQTQLTLAQDTGTYVVKAQLKDGTNVKMEKTILFQFRRAHAELIQLEASSSTWNAPTPITIKTLLTRSAGKVTIGQAVYFRSYQVLSPGDTVNAGRLEGLFNNFSTATGTLADIKVVPDTPGMDISKPLGIVAKTLTDQGDTLRVYLTIPHQ